LSKERKVKASSVIKVRNKQNTKDKEEKITQIQSKEESQKGAKKESWIYSNIII